MSSWEGETGFSGQRICVLKLTEVSSQILLSPPACKHDREAAQMRLVPHSVKVDTYLSVELYREDLQPPRCGSCGLHSSMKAAVSPQFTAAHLPGCQNTLRPPARAPQAQARDRTCTRSPACLLTSRKLRVLSELATAPAGCVTETVLPSSAPRNSDT